MNDAYRIVSKCIKQLKSFSLPTKQKLEIETRLIQVKRLLLALEGKVRDAECRKELDMDAFYTRFVSLCSSPEGDAVEKLRSHTEGLAVKVVAMVEAAGKGRAERKEET